MFVKPVDRNNFHASVLRETKRIRKDIFDSSASIFAYSGKRISKSYIQRYIYESAIENISSIFKDMALDACFKSETASGGVGDDTFEIIIETTPSVISKAQALSPHQMKDYLREKESFWIDYFIKNSSHLDRSSFRKITRDAFPDSDLRDIIFETIRLSGADSPIFVKRSNKKDTIVKKDMGFVFNLSIDDRLKNLIRGTWKRKDVNCAVIDGMIESESEIHHLLQLAAETKEPFLVFCRGMSDTVASTISFNLARETIDLIPVSVGFDENTLNILNDIAIVVGCDIVSHLQGDLISTCIKKLGTIDRVEIEKNKKISISCRNSNKKLAHHLKYLKDKKSKTEAGGVSDLIENRIRSLSSNKVTIETGTDLCAEFPDVIEKFDFFFRSLRAYMVSGITNVNDEKNLDDFDKKIFKIMKKRKKLPLLGAIHIIKNSFSFLDNISSVGFCLIEE